MFLIAILEFFRLIKQIFWYLLVNFVTSHSAAENIRRGKSAHFSRGKSAHRFPAFPSVLHHINVIILLSFVLFRLFSHFCGIFCLLTFEFWWILPYFFRNSEFWWFFWISELSYSSRSGGRYKQGVIWFSKLFWTYHINT